MNQLTAPAVAAPVLPSSTAMIFAGLSGLLRGALVLMLAGVIERGQASNTLLLGFVFLNTIVVDFYAQKRLLAGLLLGDAAHADVGRMGGLWSRPIAALALPAANAALLIVAMLAFVTVISVVSALLALLVALLGHAAVAMFRSRTLRLYRMAAETASRSAAAQMRRAADLRLAEEHGLLGAIGFAAIATLVFATPVLSPDEDAISVRAALAGIVLVGPVTTMAGLVAPFVLLRSLHPAPVPVLPGLAADSVGWTGVLASGGTLSLRRGELAVLEGGTGAGKTALLRRLAGIGGPGGGVLVDATPVSDPAGALHRLVALVGQDERDRAGAVAAALSGDRPVVFLDGVLAGLDEAARGDLLTQCRAALDRKAILIAAVPRDRPETADRRLLLLEGGLSEEPNA